MHKDRIGEQFGNYRLVQFLGQGGFAEVYLGRHIHLETLAALKLLRVQIDQPASQKFLQEARTIAALEHPHIVRLLEYGIAEDQPFLVMSYAPGGTVRQHYPQGSILPPEVLVSYIQQIASALQYAHNEHLIHRDVKPENMLLGRRGELLLSDFGTALQAHREESMTTRDVIGSPAYMAPEQFFGKPRPASDQYALGVVAYEWLCGERPFIRGDMGFQHNYVDPPALSARVPNVPLAVEQVVFQALAKEPGQRFASVEEFARAFTRASRGETLSRPAVLPVPQTPVLRPPASPPEKPTMLPPLPPSRRHVLRTAVYASLLLLLLSGSLLVARAGGWLSGGGETGTPTPVVHLTPLSTSPVSDATATTIAANPDPYDQDSSVLLLDDPLSQPAQWYPYTFFQQKNQNGPREDCAFANRALDVQSENPAIFIYCPDKMSFTAFVFEAHMTILQGDCGGMVFRAAGITGRSYLFGACQDGDYFLDIIANNLVTSSLQEATFTSSLLTGLNQTNTLAVIVKGTTITLYANYQQLLSVTDATYSSGQVGLLAFPLQNATEVAYTDARVWSA